MKTLMKIKLINWHGFYDDTLEIDGATLITGENGSGKSTLLDAIYFLLTGGEENKFNSAANEKANRTLETYMRGKTGIEGKTYLREDKNLISHIAAEFYDDIAKESFVIGVVLEIQENKAKIGRSFYHIKRHGISDSLFRRRSDGAYINFRAMQNVLDDSDINSLDGSRNDIRAKISGILSLENKRYYELLPKALAFKPIGDVNDFVYKFLMPQKSVNVENIRAQIHTYNELKRQIDDDLKRKEILELIHGKNSEYTESVAIIQVLENEENKLRLRELGSKVDKEKKDVAEAKSDLDQKDQRIDAVSKLLESIKEDIYAIEHGEAYNRVKQLEGDVERAGLAFRDAERAVQNFNKYLAEEAAIAVEYGINQSFSNRIKNSDFSGLLSDIKDYQNSFKKKNEDYKYQEFSLSQELKDETERIDTLKKDLSNLRRGIIRMPHAVQNLISLLSPIVKMSSTESRPTPLCELIDLAEGADKYRDVLEAALGEKRYAIFVPESDFDRCYKEYISQTNKAGIDGSILVNIHELSDDEALEGSLATLIKTEDPRARRYVDHLLGKTLIADTPESLLSKKDSFTTRVTAHVSKGLFHVEPSTYQNPVIGIEAMKIQIAQIESNLEELEAKKGDLEKKKTKIESLLRKGEKAHFNNLLPEKNVWQILESASNTFNSLKEQLSEAQKSIGSLAPQLDGFREQKHEKESEIKDLREQRDILTKKIAVIEDKLPGQEEELESLRAKVSNTIPTMSFPKEIERILHGDEVSVSDIKGVTEKYRKKLSDSEKEIVRTMQSYISDFGFDAIANMDSQEIFETEYNGVVKRNLEQHSARLQEVKDKATETFKNAYIAEIRKNIHDEEANIQKLNKVLENKPFGYDEEKYRFKISRSNDKTFGRYYDIFRSNEDFAANDLFTDQLSDKNLALMQELFQQLVNEADDPQQHRLIEEYTDYRKFMSYDIVITNKRGEESYFSKINKEKSGGETQTPFYVIIAASFDQIIHGGYGQQSTGCLVMLDEAFNNMDESHIDSMMKYFLQLDIQPIIAVPTQRAKTIMPYANTTIGLVKLNDRVYPRGYIKKGDK
ncbi:MAG: AAA family ATPase [Bacilli bacterium]|nr:AAA family ATPase [Bacilli bacterium]